MTTRMLGAAAILVAVSVATGASLQNPASPAPAQASASRTPGAVIRGRVTTADTGLPLRRAQVYLNSTTVRDPRATGTDDNGRFEFAGLPEGTYTLSATKTGYVRGAYGQRSPSETGRPIRLTAGQSLDRTDLALVRGGVIAVTVTDRYGDPIAGVRVDPMQYRFLDGQRRLILAGTSLETDDLGQVRLHGLASGSYFVVAGQGGGSASLGVSGRTYAPTFYPGTLKAGDAQQVDLEAGRETSVALAVASVRLATITGTVRRADGTSAASVTGPNDPGLSALLFDAEGFVGPRSIPIRRDGGFTLEDVPPADYFLEARSRGGEVTAWTEYASVRLAVEGQDIRNLDITTQKGGTISGRVSFDSGRVPAGWRPQDFPVFVARTRDEGLLSAGDSTVRDDFSFEIRNVAATGVLRLLPTVSGWFTKSVVIDGRNVTNVPVTFEPGHEYRDVQFVLTQKRSEVSGTAVDGRGRAVNDFVVVIFPEERGWRHPRTQMVRAARPDQNGRFRIPILPDGRYFIVALTSIVEGSEQDPDLLQKIEPRAERLTLGEGEVKSVRLAVQDGQ